MHRQSSSGASANQNCAYCGEPLPYHPVYAGMSIDDQEDIKTENRAIYKAHLMAEHPEIAESQKREREEEKRRKIEFELHRVHHTQAADARRERMVARMLGTAPSTWKESEAASTHGSRGPHRKEHSVEYYARQRERRAAEGILRQRREEAEKKLLQVLDQFPKLFYLDRFSSFLFRINKHKYEIRSDGLYVMLQRQKYGSDEWQNYVLMSVNQLMKELVEAN